ncbi:hypothetical protein [Rhizobium ruizarguesonis]|uniref:hypothetical protein n=1 Tax=Rhizobium ruizarguesonis TaxID=2081791 RepID=UPI0010EDE64A|nr:hypothetical protein [Rhizobium ruizarguesonis]TBE96824.1 hypothetical protein ELG98_09655 [Rhizobium ruizarguesonis]
MSIHDCVQCIVPLVYASPALVASVYAVEADTYSECKLRRDGRFADAFASRLWRHYGSSVLDYLIDLSPFLQAESLWSILFGPRDQHACNLTFGLFPTFKLGSILLRSASMMSMTLDEGSYRSPLDSILVRQGRSIWLRSNKAMEDRLAARALAWKMAATIET